MTPPDSQAPPLDQGTGAPVGILAPKSSNPLKTLKKRATFLACARAKCAHFPGMVVQGRKRQGVDPEGPRVGFTCSKKVGNAVARNRAKRRLREAARLVLPRLGRDGWDYVLIGRADVTAGRRFSALVGDLEAALAKLHGGSK